MFLSLRNNPARAGKHHLGLCGIPPRGNNPARAGKTTALWSRLTMVPGTTPRRAGKTLILLKTKALKSEQPRACGENLPFRP